MTNRTKRDIHILTVGIFCDTMRIAEVYFGNIGYPTRLRAYKKVIYATMRSNNIWRYML